MPPDAGRLTGKRRAHSLAGEVVDRASEVDVHEVGAARLDERGGPGHLLGVRAGQLHAEAGLAFESTDEREFAGALLLEPPRHRHLADEHARSQLDGEATVGQV